MRRGNVASEDPVRNFYKAGKTALYRLAKTESTQNSDHYLELFTCAEELFENPSNPLKATGGGGGVPAGAQSSYFLCY